jgi:hypothetical protein
VVEGAVEVAELTAQKLEQVLEKLEVERAVKELMQLESEQEQVQTPAQLQEVESLVV